MSWLSKFWRKREKEVKKFLKQNMGEMTISDLIEVALDLLTEAGNRKGIPLLGQAVQNILDKELNK